MRKENIGWGYDNVYLTGMNLPFLSCPVRLGGIGVFSQPMVLHSQPIAGIVHQDFFPYSRFPTRSREPFRSVLVIDSTIELRPTRCRVKKNQNKLHNCS